MSVVVYIIQPERPWLAPEPFVAVLKECKASTWALPQRLNGKRFKLGSTAFLTLEAADKRRLGACARNLQAPKVGLMAYLGLSGTTDASARANPPRVYRNQLSR